ncbi:uncharacterized protein BO97DRAFT_451140 [Aspergillus homomorphus CBS 101889]|uniref:Uncharacterized protein n=1 Tax=Aspergillus homomorphus (strain CBS 101889) TaxID=1450537 RepID=A0A395I217_ASPHC|nr:hypothetical protein BO97DRAFT_451140 [Aspergillus homomorphus CBS 101889]RAL12594.1 hypothetical protein BO97DRAFT_451140 [Aspergillus homomorphus CBS 101889]
MRWEFVDENSAISTTTRKRIRSHVARGKNAGRTCRRPPRLSSVGDKPSSFQVPIIIANAHAVAVDRDRDLACHLERPITNGLIFPVELAPQTRIIAEKVLDFLRDLRGAPELFHIVEEPNAPLIWVQYMFLDEAYLHSVLATSFTLIPGLVSEKDKAAETLRHLSRTLRLINDRLSGVNATSDDTIAAVVGMVHYERHQGQFGRALVHTRGLRQLADLRGGVRGLSSELSMKIFLCDLECSFQLGCDTLFSAEDVDAMSMETARNDLGSRIAIGWACSQHIDPYLLILFRHGLGFALSYNDIGAGRRARLSYTAYYDMILSFGYRLMQVNPLQQRQPRIASHLDEVIHLGLIAFLCAFIRRLDQEIADNQLLAKLLRSVADKIEAGSEAEEALLWALFVSTASVFRKNVPGWLASKARALIQSLGLRTWSHTLCLISKYPWVNALHDKPAQLFWLTIAPFYGSSGEMTDEMGDVIH